MMFKLKPIYRYLGDADFDLNARIDARCPTCSPANNPVAVHSFTEGTLTTVSSTLRRYPEAVKINDNMFLLLSLKSDSTILYYRVITVETDGSLTLGTETALVTAANVATYHSTSGDCIKCYTFLST
jgi:hypothetical protein